jgi:hypothetical protein
MKTPTVHITDLEKEVVKLIYDKKVKEAAHKMADNLFLKMKSDKSRAYKYALESIKDHLSRNLNRPQPGYIQFVASWMNSRINKGKFNI